MEAQAGDARLPAQALPIALHARIGQRVAPTLHAIIGRAVGDGRENELRMMPAQRPQDLTDCFSDCHRDSLAALSKLDDLAGAEIDFRPAQKAFVEPPASCLKAK